MKSMISSGICVVLLGTGCELLSLPSVVEIHVRMPLGSARDVPRFRAAVMIRMTGKQDRSQPVVVFGPHRKLQTIKQVQGRFGLERSVNVVVTGQNSPEHGWMKLRNTDQVFVDRCFHGPGNGPGHFQY